MRTKKSNIELGYIIPVQKKMSVGKYKIAFAKSLTPDKNNQIRVRTHNLFSKTWSADNVTKIPNYEKNIL